MKHYQLEHLDATVHLLTEPQDETTVNQWMERTSESVTLSVDTETTSLDIFRPGYRVKLVQLGDSENAYVWRPEDYPALTFKAVATRKVHYWNQAHDLLSLDVTGFASIEETAMYSVDVEVYSRLIDPRGRKDGGIPHSLKEQSNERLGYSVSDAKDVLVDYAKKKYSYKTKEEVWEQIPWDDVEYVKYAGQDVILTSRVADHLRPMVHALDLEERVSFQHRLLYDVMYVRRKGWLYDPGYAAKAALTMQDKSDAFDAQLSQFGFAPAAASGRYSTSTGLGAALEALGAPLTDQTPTGAWKLDKEVLAVLAGIGLNEYTEEVEDDALEATEHDYQRMAVLILMAKKYQRMATYCASFADFADTNNRIHADVKPLAAKTGRMSASNPPLQQLPRDVPEPRACFLADAGHTLVSIDYAAIEWRVAAAVTDDANMKLVFERGGDMHALVADLVYGEGNWGKKERQQIKSVGLGKLYGGGVDTLSRQSGLPKPIVQKVINAINRLFPGIKGKSGDLQKRVNGEETRLRLSIDETYGRYGITSRGYSALNLFCQGIAGDILSEGIVRLTEAGFRDHMRMFVHDEILFSFPEQDAELLMEEARRIMETELDGVKIVAEGEILGKVWRK